MFSVVLVFVILNQTKGVVGFGYDKAILLNTQKTSDLIDINGDIVKSCGFPGDSQALVVVLHGLHHFLFLEELICHLAILFK